MAWDGAEVNSGKEIEELWTEHCGLQYSGSTINDQLAKHFAQLPGSLFP